MGTTDIVARLQLRAEQFSSETGQRFAEMKARAASAAQEVKSSFASSFADVQKIAQQSLTLPRTNAGSLDLSSEIASLQASASAADQNAIALREVAVAAETASRAAGVDAEALRLRADAASVASLAAERDAAAIRQEILSLRTMQVELNRSASLTRVDAEALDVVTRGSGRASLAKMELQHVVRSSADAFAAGIPIMTIFGSELGRVAEAAALAGGGAEGTGALSVLGRFLGGPWGLAVTAGIAVLTPFVAELFETKSAADTAKSGLDDLERAQRALASAIDATTGKINVQNAALAHAAAQGAPAQIEAGIRSIGQNSIDAFGAVRAAIRGAGNVSRAGPTGEVLALTRAVADANGNFLKLQANIAAIPAGSENLNKVKATVNGLGQQAATTNTSIQGLRGAMLAEQTVEAGGRVQTRDTVETEIARRTATDDSAKATVRLSEARAALTKAEATYERNGPTKAATEALNAAKDQVVAAQKVVDATNSAGDATRAHNAELREQAKAAREAAKAQRELDSQLRSIVTAFDPLSAAAERYRESLVSIAKLQSAGKIGQDDADQYRIDALRKRYDDEQAVLDQRQKDTIATLSPGFQHSLETPLLDFTKTDLTKALKNAGYAGADAFREGAIQAAEDLARILNINIGGKAGGFLSGAFSLIGGQSLEQTVAIGKLSDSIAGLVGKGLPITSKSIADLSGSIDQGLTGAVTGQQVNSVFAPIGKALGLKTSQTGAEIGGAIGSAIPIPGASQVGAVIGSIVGGLFKKTPKGSATVTGFDTGDISYKGSGSIRAGATADANSVQQGLENILSDLGANEGSFAVSIGKKGKKYEVDRDGLGRTSDGGKPGGVKSFKDEASAVAFAIQDAVRDGAIKGISAASQRLLLAAPEGGLDAAIQKAALIEAIPKDLKSIVDPVGAAIDALNAKFKKTVDALTEGGASADQMAQAQRLYTLELDQTKASTDAADKTLQDFRKNLMLGGDSPYSLRDQEVTARAALQPYLDTIDGGGTIDQSKYQDAAQAFLDVERQLYGSTQQYFDALDAVQASTAKAIATVDNATPISAAVPDPFTKAAADSAAATASGVQTGNQIATDHTALLQQAVAALQTLAANGNTAAPKLFIGMPRNFA